MPGQLVYAKRRVVHTGVPKGWRGMITSINGTLSIVRQISDYFGGLAVYKTESSRESLAYEQSKVPIGQCCRLVIDFVFILLTAMLMCF